MPDSKRLHEEHFFCTILAILGSKGESEAHSSSVLAGHLVYHEEESTVLVNCALRGWSLSTITDQNLCKSDLKLSFFQNCNAAILYFYAP